MNMAPSSNYYSSSYSQYQCGFYQCGWFYCEDAQKKYTDAQLLLLPTLTPAQAQAYRASRVPLGYVTFTARAPRQTGKSWAQQYQQAYNPSGTTRTTMAKQVRITYLYNDTIVELHFITRPQRGWFKDNIQPMIDILKSAIPATAREYDPSTFKWQIAIEYWPALKQILEASQFDIKVMQPSAGAQGVNVPKDYAENFYHKPVAPKAETKESILTQLSALLGIHEDIASMELVALKKKYREAARRYHPDFGGDSAKMSELNRVWTIYNSGGSN
jgi:hypothetical protein